MSDVEVKVDVGGSETKIIVTGPGGVIHSQVLPAAGDSMDEAIVQSLRRKYKLRIGMKTAEVLKNELGTVGPPQAQRAVEVRGRRLVDNALETVSVSDSDVREAIGDEVGRIINAVTTAVKRVPPELSASVVARGIALKGGKKLPKNIDQALTAATGLTVRRT